MLFLLTIGLNEEEKSEITKIYYEYRDLMKIIAIRYVRDESIADDIVQGAFFKIRKKLSILILLSCKKKRSYIVNIVKSTCLDYLRKEKRYRDKVELSKNNLLDRKFYIDSTEELFDREEFRLKIQKIICQMDEKYSTPLILKCYYGYRTKEICAKLNISSENTVSSLIYRGKKEFLKIYNKDEE